MRPLVPAGAPALAAVLLALGSLTACSVDAKNATPRSTAFAFGGDTLDVRAHGIPTDLVAADRKDVEVTRWFDAKAGSKKTLVWKLHGRTLDLDARCKGLALCDARFRVEVPRGLTVLRDGRPTKLRGGKH
ncbi:hypothetical protein OG896_29165 [Streptomyces sp. NBC_00669]|uniref:hypothetical protein n=1 Tax=unclassified Streptomyces TaxID=2593676 RepID=UPI002E32ED4C|nr:hypothetical protein [Streptomyces sp. NBC_00669]